MARSSKGSAFERELSRQISLWWTADAPDGPRDDLVWRSSNSGGRATIRARQGKRTAGHCGDLAPTSPEIEPLFRAFAIEAKCGYPRATLHDLLDRPTTAALQQWEKWVEQAQAAARNAGAKSWLIIHRRDRRLPLVVLPWEAHRKLRSTGIEAVTELLFDGRRYVCKTLADFFKHFQPEHIINLIRE